MKHILLAEDDFDFGSILKQYLELHGYQVIWAKDGKEALQVFSEKQFDICVFDVMMPKMDGFTLAEKVIDLNPEIPFVFLTAKKLKEDKIRGLKLGADDYIVKPFEADILVLRLQNILKRTKRVETIQEEIVSIGKYTFHATNHCLLLNEEKQKLTEKETVLIQYLYEHKNTMIKREQLLKDVWGNDDFFSGRSMDVFISRLRKYFKKDQQIKLKSVRGVGLTFIINHQSSIINQKTNNMKTTIKVLIFLLMYVGISQSNTDELEHTLDAIYKNSKISGFGVSVMTPDKVLFKKGFGYADKETEIKYSVNTIQNIGSKHLATHTSSILDTDAYEKSYVFEENVTLDLQKYTKDKQKEYTKMSANQRYSLKEFLYNHLTTKGAWYSKNNYKKQKPGERYEYSNVGSALLAYIIELATEMPFEAYTKKHIFDVLKMKNTGWSYKTIDVSQHAKTYTEHGQMIPQYSLITYPDGGIRTNINNLTIYLQELMKGYYGSGKLITKESFIKMMSPKITKKQFNTKKELDDNYGFFWEVSPKGKMGHNGSDPGILTLMYFDKEEKVGAIFFMNTSLEEDKDIINTVQNIWRTIKKYKNQYISNL